MPPTVRSVVLGPPRPVAPPPVPPPSAASPCMPCMPSLSADPPSAPPPGRGPVSYAWAPRGRPPRRRRTPTANIARAAGETAQGRREQHRCIRAPTPGGLRNSSITGTPDPSYGIGRIEPYRFESEAPAARVRARECGACPGVKGWTGLITAARPRAAGRVRAGRGQRARPLAHSSRRPVSAADGSPAGACRWLTAGRDDATAPAARTTAPMRPAGGGGRTARGDPLGDHRLPSAGSSADGPVHCAAPHRRGGPPYRARQSRAAPSAPAPVVDGPQAGAAGKRARAGRTVVRAGPSAGRRRPRRHAARTPAGDAHGRRPSAVGFNPASSAVRRRAGRRRRGLVTRLRSTTTCGATARRPHPHAGLGEAVLGSHLTRSAKADRFSSALVRRGDLVAGEGVGAVLTGGGQQRGRGVADHAQRRARGQERRSADGRRSRRRRGPPWGRGRRG